jgi:2-polyprenyl-3-methyl-5-hydroxy-6-metoxy-1,4-benzoquinol methylase
MREKPWQLRIFDKSLKKKEKLKLLEKSLAIRSTERLLDLGCAQGMLSYFLRQKGGFWISTDQDFSNLKQTQSLVQKNLVQTGPCLLPFRSQSFDLVVCLDYLEHVEDDTLCLEEISRALKENGRLVLVTPHTGRLFLLHKLRSALGLKLEYFGHKREGYNLKTLEQMLVRAHFSVLKAQTYSRFFSEFLELIINFVYIKILSPKTSLELRDGHIRPSNSSEFHSQQKTFKLYSFIYPVVWLFSRLDAFLIFQKGYSLMVWAQKKALNKEKLKT